jgi:hypothetical protein
MNKPKKCPWEIAWKVLEMVVFIGMLVVVLVSGSR